GETAETLTPEGFTLATLVEQIARQIGQEDILRMRLQDRRAAVKTLLVSKGALIVADNLDTVQNSKEFVRDLVSILGKSKALCTSRHGLKNEQLYYVAL